jgi:glycosyltransferase involved in cell wall biosynthesis
MKLNGKGSIWRRIARKPPRQILQGLVARLGDRVEVRELEFPLEDADVFDSRRALALLSPSASRTPGSGRRIAWVVVPPGVGSGGHTTLFRMIQAASAAGLDNTLLFYDRYHGDFDINVERVRRGWPWLQCRIEPIGETITGFDACVASSWPTAHVVGSRTSGQSMARLYFIQDFEPYFYPRGAMYALAEDTYRFGFCNIALGQMVRDTILARTGVESVVVPFGSDPTTYRLEHQGPPRRGIAFFAKVNSDRRGFRIAVLALREFHRRHPDEPIHVYGDRLRARDLPMVNHGYLSPEQLNDLYNSVVAGLVLSFTNISLIPAELAAAGAVPVVNDDAGARTVFDHPSALWTSATPTAIADALSEAVRAVERDAIASAVAAWRGPTWDDTAHEVIRIIREGAAA